MEQATGYFTLKHAAQVLGVRQQTLKTLERRGVIRLTRAEGGRRYHVSEEEIGRLQEKLNTRLPATNSVLVPPRSDEESLSLAEELARLVMEEIEGQDPEISLDEAMAAQRGRTWLG